ncbi:MAG TPA: hypothetical protein VMW38_23300 [Terriglobia bacterium]|nr:hypothetical protein [Terriglobia bacterium]
MVIANGSRLMLCGIAIGLGNTLFLSRYLALYLVEVNPLDPRIYSGVCGILLLLGLLACYLPARRAANAGPMTMLRVNEVSFSDVSVIRSVAVAPADGQIP